VTGGPSEGRLRDRAANFEDARPHLDHFLRVLERLDAGDMRRRLLRLVGWEAEKLLAATDRMLKADSLYRMDGVALDNWNGGAGLAQRVFHAPTRGELVAHLARQRGRLETLAQHYARPALTFLYDHARDYNPDRLGAFAKWRVILENLKRYGNDAPGNPIQRLERFVLGPLRSVTTDSCAELGGNSAVEGDGFVAGRLRELRGRARTACLRRQGQELRARYNALAERFNARLAGRAPFIQPGAWSDAQAVAPSELAGFVEQFDRAMNAGLGDPRQWRGAGPGEEVRRFLTRMDRAAAALRPALERRAGETRFGYDVEVTFRVNRAEEQAASHIIDWRFAAGGSARSLTNAGEPVSWRAGQPVAVALRWAQNAPTEPAGAAEIADLNVSGRTARFAVGGRYALLGLIARHRADSEGPSGNRLRFEVPIAYLGTADSAARLQGGRARVYLRLGLRAGEQPVEVPVFPTRAPRLTGDEPAGRPSQASRM
jgi:hypothetical protein